MLNNTEKQIVNNDSIVESSDVNLDDLISLSGSEASMISLTDSETEARPVSMCKSAKTAVIVIGEGEESSASKKTKKSKKSKKTKRSKKVIRSAKTVITVSTCRTSDESSTDSSSIDIESQEPTTKKGKIKAKSTKKEATYCESAKECMWNNLFYSVLLTCFLVYYGWSSFIQWTGPLQTTHHVDVTFADGSASCSDSSAVDSFERDGLNKDEYDEAILDSEEWEAQQRKEAEKKAEEKTEDKPEEKKKVEEKKDEKKDEFELPKPMDVPSHLRRQGGKRKLVDLHLKHSNMVKGGAYGTKLITEFSRCFPDFFMEMCSVTESGKKYQESIVKSLTKDFESPRAYAFRYEDPKVFAKFMEKCHDWRRAELFGLGQECELNKYTQKSDWIPVRKEEADHEKCFRRWNEGVNSQQFQAIEQQRAQLKMRSYQMFKAGKGRLISDKDFGPMPHALYTIEEYKKEFEGKEETDAYFHFLFSHLSQFSFIEYQGQTKAAFDMNDLKTNNNIELLALYCGETDAKGENTEMHTKLAANKKFAEKVVKGWTTQFNMQKEVVSALLAHNITKSMSESTKFAAFAERLNALLNKLNSIYTNSKVVELMTLLEAENRDWDAIWAAEEAYTQEMETENHQMIENTAWRNLSGSILDLVNNNTGEDEPARTACQSCMADCCCCAGNIGKTLGCWSIANGQRNQSCKGKMVWWIFLLGFIFLIFCFGVVSNTMPGCFPEDMLITKWGVEEEGTNFVGDAFASGTANGGLCGEASCPLMTIGLSLGGAAGAAVAMFITLHVLATLWQIPKEMCGCMPCCQGQGQRQ